MKLMLPSRAAAALLAASLILIAATWDEPEYKADELGDAQLMKAVTVPISVADAVAIAERHTGGHVLEASFYYLPLRSTPIYALRTYQNGAVWEAKMDAITGEIVDRGEVTLGEALEPEDRTEVSGVQTATLTILDAIRAAERYSNGKAVSADLETTGTVRAFWEVLVVIDGKARRLLIDPAPVRWAYQMREHRILNLPGEINQEPPTY